MTSYSGTPPNFIPVSAQTDDGCVNPHRTRPGSAPSGLVSQRGLKLKLFTEKQLCISEELSSLNPVLAFHWAELSREDRERGLHNPSSPFTLVEHPAEADLCLLPREWNYYLWHRKKDEAERIAERARQYGKKILIWFRGDLPPIIPIANAAIFKSAMNRSRQQDNQFAAPYFIDDPLPKYISGRSLLRAKSEKPVVGFCGYAGVKAVKLLYSLAANSKYNLSVLLGQSNYESMPIVPATILRARALKLLSRDERVSTDFIIRDKYRAGEKKRSLPQSTAAQDFFDNIYRTDYTVCLRGYGNWSIRFYETLACGRIPLFIDTDCVLPFEFAVDWRKYCVWVDQSELPRIADILSDFHARLSADDFLELQQSCRQLWEQRLSLSGFMKHLSEHFQ